MAQSGKKNQRPKVLICYELLICYGSAHSICTQLLVSESSLQNCFGFSQVYEKQTVNIYHIVYMTNRNITSMFTDFIIQLLTLPVNTSYNNYYNFIYNYNNY